MTNTWIDAVPLSFVVWILFVLDKRVAGVATVKSFAREELEARRFYDRTTELYDLSIENVKLTSEHRMFTEFITRAAPLVVIWAGSLLIIRGRMALGTMVAFYAYPSALYLPLQRFLGTVEHRC